MVVVLIVMGLVVVVVKLNIAYCWKKIIEDD